MQTIPPPENVLTFSRARFTLLSPRMIRLEWAEDRGFEDRLTLMVCNRRTEPVRYSSTLSGNRLRLQTDHLLLEYREDGRPFHRGNLRIQFELGGKTVRWFPGKADPGNLKGTARTLDGARGNRKKTWVPAEERRADLPVLACSRDKKSVFQGEWNEEVPLTDGLISRSGWAVADDSRACVLDSGGSAGQPWILERPPGQRLDLYFLGHGHDYKGAVRDAARIFGAQPLPPRYTLGYWYSRYWAYTDKELLKLAGDFDDMNLPLDVLVIDMDWHKPGWTGYSWDRDYFPDPAGLLRTLKSKRLKISLNLHPADGVFDFEDAFPDMLREMGLRRKDLPELGPEHEAFYKTIGIDPAGRKRIPLNVCDPDYMRAYFACLHHPLEKMGVDFWWMDWQQGRAGSALPSLDTLPWINELHWQDQVRSHPRRRPLNFSRFGGLGSGRMPVGFSGDTVISWDSLAYQPGFTASAANVLFGCWSHDIGGHMEGELSPELFTRWMQFGLFSPVLRTHSAKSDLRDRRLFHFQDPFRPVLFQTVQRRYELVPYIYRELRNAADSGLSLLRPLYYDHPESPEAYRCPREYMFGDDMLVAPVVSPMDPETGLAEVNVWLPEGRWFDTVRGMHLAGGRTHRLSFTLGEVPVFVRPGTVLPEQSCVRRLDPGSFPDLVFRIHPGPSGEGRVYEDDGISEDWRRGRSAEFTLRHEVRGRERHFHLVCSRPGSFKGFRPRRRVRILLEGVPPPADTFGLPAHYDGDRATLQLEPGLLDLRQEHQFRITEAPPAHHRRVEGLKGWMTRLEAIRALLCSVSPPRPLHADERLIVRLAQTGNRIGRNPAGFRREMDQFHRDLARLPGVLRGLERAFRRKASQTGTSQDRQISATRRAAAMLTASLTSMESP